MLPFLLGEGGGSRYGPAVTWLVSDGHEVTGWK